MPWTSEEHLVTPELLEEAHETYRANFKPDTWFERTMYLSWNSSFNCTFCRLIPKKTQNIAPLSAKRPPSSLIAEAYLARQLSWKTQLSTGYMPYNIKELFELVQKFEEVNDEQLWLETLPMPGSDIDILKPYLQGINAPLETINKGIRRRYYTDFPLNNYLTMFDDATNLKKGVTIILGIGESLQDIEEFHRFLTMNNIDKVTFTPIIPHKKTPFKQGPSSFYLTRWIAETRIAFPKLEISAGTWKGRVAEVGLFLKAGANTISKFPIVKNFSSEDARSIEQEMKTAERMFISTLTDVEKLHQIKDIEIDPETKDKLMRYVQTIQHKN
jgi:biotin synthase-like enzyme